MVRGTYVLRGVRDSGSGTWLSAEWYVVVVRATCYVLRDTLVRGTLAQHGTWYVGTWYVICQKGV
jgi:hypothetical protein